MHNLTLNPLWHTVMPAYQSAVCASTLCFSTLAIYLLVKKTPQSARTFAKYLIFLQASITLVDVAFGLLVRPIVLYPLSGALCNGILSTWFDLSCHVGASIMFGSFALVGLAVNYCVHYRHASIELIVGYPSITTAHRRAYRLISLATMILFCLFYVGRFRELDTGSQSVRKEFPSLNYLFENLEYRAFAYDTAGFPEYERVFRIATICNILMSAVTIAYFATSAFSCLFKQKWLSEKTRQMQIGTLRLLLLQTVTPLAMQLVPALMFLYSIQYRALDLDINNFALCIQHLHAFIHTSILIMTTPSYREPFIFWKKPSRSMSSISTLQTRWISGFSIRQ